MHTTKEKRMVEKEVTETIMVETAMTTRSKYTLRRRVHRLQRLPPPYRATRLRHTELTITMRYHHIKLLELDKNG